MKLLLDTRIFLWWTHDDPRLRGSHREAIRSPQNTVYVSAVSAWEIGIKRTIGKLAFTGSIADAIRRHRFETLAISVEHAEEAGGLPMLHSDPFDRLLVAQAKIEGLVLATVDTLILRYAVRHL